MPSAQPPFSERSETPAQIGDGAQRLETENLFRAVVDAQVDMVSLARGDGTLVFVNSAYAREFGKTADEMAGLNLYDFVDPQDVELVRHLLAGVLDTGKSTRSENRMRFADGTERWVAWTNGVLVSRGERLLHSVGQ